MYWWNVSKLTEDLREGRVDEKERFKYFLATLIGWALVGRLVFYFRSPFDILDLLFVAVNLTAIVVGTILCYRANKQCDNTDFIGRMVCLGWPVGIRVAAMTVPLFIMGGIFAAIKASDSASPELGSILYSIPLRVSELWTTTFCGSFGITMLWLYFVPIKRQLLQGFSSVRLTAESQAMSANLKPVLAVLGLAGGVALLFLLPCFHIILGLPQSLSFFLTAVLFMVLLALLAVLNQVRITSRK